MFHPKTKIVKWLYEMGRAWELLDDRTTWRWNYKIQNNILSGRQSSWGTDKWIWEGLYFQTFEKTEKIFWFEKCNLFFWANWFRSCWRYFRPGLIRGFSIQEDSQFRWLKIKVIYAAFPGSITLFSNHLNEIRPSKNGIFKPSKSNVFPKLSIS